MGKFYRFIPHLTYLKKITRHKGRNGSWIMSSKKPFTDGKLYGKVNGEATIIHFFFDPLEYGFTQKNFIESTILINIRTFITCNGNFSYPMENVQLTYRSLQLHKFLDLMPRYEISPNFDNGLCGQVSCILDTTNLISEKLINDCNVKIQPYLSCTWGGSKFKFYPEILISVSLIRDELDLLKIYDSIIKLIQYAFMRTNIYPDSFYIQINNGLKGEVYSNITNVYIEEPEDCNTIWRDSIPWSIYYEHMLDIFEQIYNGNWYMDNIPQTKDERFFVSDVIISKEAAAFEHEFNESFPKGLPTHSDSRLAIEEEVKQELVPLFESSSGKKRKIYKGFIDHIRNDALVDKLEYCFTQYASCLEWIYSKLGKDMSFEKMSEICSNIRNDVDHGNKKIVINDEVARGYGIMRALIYAMQMKRMGYEEKGINIAIKNLFSMKGII